jgi:hypothetical protein
MTLKSKGPNFPTFLEKLLSQMAYGKTLPVAWNAYVNHRYPARILRAPAAASDTH